jgi:hypothetical protein
MPITPWIFAHQQLSHASSHFRSAVAQYLQGALFAPGREGEGARSHFMRSMLAGQNALETALEQTLSAFETDGPFDPDCQGSVLERASCATSRRVAILEMDTALWAQTTARFQDLAHLGEAGLLQQNISVWAMAAWHLSQRLVPGYLQFLKMGGAT